MLRESYPIDKRFEEILGYLPKMDPGLAKIDRYLEDEKLYQLIKRDLAKRWPKTLETGRNSTPVEVVLRMLVVRDSLVLRQFCRVYLQKVPVDTTLMRLANVIRPKTLEQFNERITQLAMEHKVTKGRKLRTDGTLVETNIHAPSDSRQLADSVRVLARTIVRAKTVLRTGRQKLCKQFQDFTQAVRQTARQIGETLSQRTEAAREAGKQKYQELLEMTEKRWPGRSKPRRS